MSDGTDYYRLFAESLLTTLLVELAVLFLAVRLYLKMDSRKLSSPLLLFAGIFASTGTLPWLWFVLPRIFQTYVTLVVVGELLVWAVEALFYKVVLALGWKQSGVLSLACNLASFSVGLMRQ